MLKRMKIAREGYKAVTKVQHSWKCKAHFELVSCCDGFPLSQSDKVKGWLNCTRSAPYKAIDLWNSSIIYLWKQMRFVSMPHRRLATRSSRLYVTATYIHWSGCFSMHSRAIARALAFAVENFYQLNEINLIACNCTGCTVWRWKTLLTLLHDCYNLIISASRLGYAYLCGWDLD